VTKIPNNCTNNDTYIFFEHIWEHAMYHMKGKHQPVSLEQGPAGVGEDGILQQRTQRLDSMLSARALLCYSAITYISLCPEKCNP